MERQWDGLTIEVVPGDITEQRVDAIVNAANNHLRMGMGVAKAIRSKGGEIIAEEALAQGPIPIGEAAVTTGGALPAEFVIHAAAMGLDLKTDENKIRAATTNALRRAEELGLSSLAFPALGTGVGGFDPQECAKAMLGAIEAFRPNLRSVQRIVFVLFEDHVYQDFLTVLEAWP